MSRDTLNKQFGMILPRVHLVGAGPGDPGLISRKGAHLLGTADVVLYDHLVSLELLDLAPPHALRIDVGKIRNHPRMSQSEIEAIMIDHARKGKTVVRLKGGDPFVFGRGGEEAQALKNAGIPFSVVPGISSTIAVPAYAGVPVTHRDHNSRLIILTAHDNPEKWTVQDVAALTSPNQTIVVLMGVLFMKQLAKRLLQAGLSETTPVLLVRWGTTPDQQSFETTLGDLSRFLDRTPLTPPVTLLIGGVVALRPEIAWIQRLPLFGKRILLTRERESSTELMAILEGLGATVISCPTISVVPESTANAESSLLGLAGFSWLVFLSPNGVRHFLRKLCEKKIDLRSLAGIRFFSMGPATTEALEMAGLFPDSTPESSHGQGVIDTFASFPEPHNESVLIIRGDKGTGLIPEGLRKLGFSVETIGIYANHLPSLPDYKRERLESLLNQGAIDLVIHYSPSAVQGLLKLFPDHHSKILTIPALAIGPTTAGALSEAHVQQIIESKTPTAKGIIESALDFLSPIGNNSGIAENPKGESPSHGNNPFDSEERVTT